MDPENSWPYAPDDHTIFQRNTQLGCVESMNMHCCAARDRNRPCRTNRTNKAMNRRVKKWNLICSHVLILIIGFAWDGRMASICVLSLCLQFQKALTVDVKNRTQYMTQQNQSPKKLSPHLKGTKHTPWIRVKLVHCKRMLLLI